MCSIVLDVNECLLPDACSPGLVCKNSDGSYRCECPPGFSQTSSSQNDSNPVCNGKKLKVTLMMLCTQLELFLRGEEGGGGGVEGIADTDFPKNDKP